MGAERWLQITASDQQARPSLACRPNEYAAMINASWSRKQALRPLDITREPQYDRFAGGS